MVEGEGETNMSEIKEHVYYAKYSEEDIDLICKQALAKWGKLTQILMCIEELSELICALFLCASAKADRKINSVTKEEIASEIADVQLMLRQMKIVFGINDIVIASIEEEKLDRLKDYLLEEEREAKPT
jgi:hypothetical protein